MDRTPKVRSKQGVVKIDDTEIDVVCSNFGDRVLLLVTSLNKVGTLLEVSRDSLLASSGCAYSVKTLLGKDEPQIHAFGRALASKLTTPPEVSVLLGIGLKEHTPSILNSLLPKLEEFRTWD